MGAKYEFGVITEVLNVSDPTTPQSAATKAYVDSRPTGMQYLDTLGTSIANVVTALVPGQNTLTVSGDVTATILPGDLIGISSDNPLIIYTVRNVSFTSPNSNILITTNFLTAVPTTAYVAKVVRTPYTEVVAGANVTLGVTNGALAIASIGQTPTLVEPNWRTVNRNTATNTLTVSDNNQDPSYAFIGMNAFSASVTLNIQSTTEPVAGANAFIQLVASNNNVVGLTNLLGFQPAAGQTLSQVLASPTFINQFFTTPVVWSISFVSPNQVVMNYTTSATNPVTTGVGNIELELTGWTSNATTATGALTVTASNGPPNFGQLQSRHIFPSINGTPQTGYVPGYSGTNSWTWQPGGISAAITSINSQTGPAITIQAGQNTSIATANNAITIGTTGGGGSGGQVLAFNTGPVTYSNLTYTLGGNGSATDQVNEGSIYVGTGTAYSTNNAIVLPGTTTNGYQFFNTQVGSASTDFVAGTQVFTIGVSGTTSAARTAMQIINNGLPYFRRLNSWYDTNPQTGIAYAVSGSVMTITYNIDAASIATTDLAPWVGCAVQLTAAGVYSGYYQVRTVSIAGRNATITLQVASGGPASGTCTLFVFSSQFPGYIGFTSTPTRSDLTPQAPVVATGEYQVLGNRNLSFTFGTPFQFNGLWFISINTSSAIINSATAGSFDFSNPIVIGGISYSTLVVDYIAAPNNFNLRIPAGFSSAPTVAVPSGTTTSVWNNGDVPSFTSFGALSTSTPNGFIRITIQPNSWTANSLSGAFNSANGFFLPDNSANAGTFAIAWDVFCSVGINVNSLAYTNSAANWNNRHAFNGVAGGNIGIPNLTQVLGAGNGTNNLPIIFQDRSTPLKGITLNAPTTVSASYSLLWPAAQATSANQALTNDGLGNLSWSTVGATNVLPLDNLVWTNSGQTFASSKTAALQTVSGTIDPTLSFITLAATLTGAVDGTPLIGTTISGQTVSGFYMVVASIPSVQTLNIDRASALVANTAYAFQWRIGRAASSSLYIDSAGVGTGTLVSELGFDATKVTQSLVADAANPGRYLLSFSSLALTTGSVSTQPTASNDLVRLTDLQTSQSGLRPIPGVNTWIAEVQITGITYTPGATTAGGTWNGTSQINLNGGTPAAGDTIVFVNQSGTLSTGHIGNGGFTITSNVSGNFTATRSTTPTYGNFYVSLSGTNRGTQYQNVTTGTITLTTPIVFAQFGVASAAQTLNQVLGAGKTATGANATGMTLGADLTVPLRGAQFTVGGATTIGWSWVGATTSSIYADNNGAQYHNATSLSLFPTATTDALQLSNTYVRRNGTGNLSILAGTNNGDAVILGTNNATTPNNIAIFSATAGFGATITAQGSDANIPLVLTGKGTSGVTIGSNLVNYLMVSGGTATNPIALNAAGSDTNIGININSKGTGSFTLSGVNNGLQIVTGTTAGVTLSPNTSQQTLTNSQLRLAGLGSNVNTSAIVIGTNFPTALTVSGSGPVASPAQNAKVTLQPQTGGASTTIDVNVLGIGSGNVILSNPTQCAVQVLGNQLTQSVIQAISTNLANCSLLISPQGLGNITLGSIDGTNAQWQLQTGNANQLIEGVSGGGTNVDRLISAKGTGGVYLGTQFANYIGVIGAAVNNRPILTSVGAASDLGLQAASGTIYGLSLIQASKGVSLNSGTFVTPGFAAPLFAANAFSSPTDIVSGNTGQFLVSRGAGASPAWVGPGGYLEGSFTSSTVIPGGADTLLNWATVSNNLSALSYSNGVFTANRACSVAFSMQVVFTSAASSSESDVWFSKNGVPGTGVRYGQSNFSYANTSTEASSFILTSSWTFRLAANDTIRCYCWTSSSSTTINIGNAAFGGANSRCSVTELTF